jgi:hypothetical protein
MPFVFRPCLAVVAAFLGLTTVAFGQGFPPQVPGRPVIVGIPANLGRLVERMTERVRSLRHEVTEEMGRDPAGRYLMHDLQELDRALDDLRAQLPVIASDPFQVRQRFSGIDASWRHVSARLTGPVLGRPSVVQAARRVDEADAELVNAVGLNAVPADYYAAQAPAANGLNETRRLAHSLTDRAEALAAIVRAEAGRRPEAGRLVAETTALARDADRFHDRLDSFGGRPDAISAAFTEVTRHSANVQADLQAIGEPPSIIRAWRAYQAVESLLRTQIPLVGVVSPAPVVVAPTAPAVVPVSNVAAWSDQLVREIDPFLASIRGSLGRIPEGPELLIDTQRLREAAVHFRNHAARGADLPRLAHEFREVDVSWQRLARRLYRVSRGQQFGPNIDLVKQMGATIAQIHQTLGMPGYAPAVVISPR